MTEQDAINLVADALQVPPDKINRDAVASDFAEWDSMGMLAILTVLDRRGVRIDPAEVDKLTTMHEILGAIRHAGKLD